MSDQNRAITPIFVGIASIFVCSVMIANLAAGRLVDFFGLVITGDLFLFPITYIFGDILTEVYGFRRSRLVIWLGMLANLIMVSYLNLIISLPPPEGFTEVELYATVFRATPLIVFASICAYLSGEFTNSIILSIVKKATKGRFLVFRTMSSTIVGQLVDTVVFMTIAFSHSTEWNMFVHMVIVQYLFKVTYEFLATPITYYVISTLKRIEAIDVYDYGVRYSPFAILTCDD